MQHSVSIRLLLLVTFTVMAVAIFAFATKEMLVASKVKATVDEFKQAAELIVRSRSFDYTLADEALLGAQYLAKPTPQLARNLQDKAHLTNRYYQEYMNDFREALPVSRPYYAALFEDFSDSYSDLKLLRSRLLEGEVHPDTWQDALSDVSSNMNRLRDELFIAETPEQFILEQYYRTVKAAHRLFDYTSREGVVLTQLIIGARVWDEEVASRLIYIRQEQDEARQELTRYFDKIDKQTNILSETAPESLKVSLNNLKEAFSKIEATRRQVYAASLMENNYAVSKAEWLAQLDLVQESIKELETVINAPSLRAMRDRQFEASSYLYSVVIITLIVLVGMGLMFMTLRRRVLRPVQQITEQMSALAAGEVAVDLPDAKYHDEIGNMLEALEIFKNNAREIQKKATLLQLAEDVAKIGNWQYDKISERITWSDEVYYIHGMQPGDAITLDRALQFYHPEDRDRVVNIIDGALHNRHDFQFESRIVPAHGAIRYVEARGVCQTDERGTIIGMYGTFQDITERKRQEEELENYRLYLEDLVKGRTTELQIAKEKAESANIAKSEFLANMSHELRTPMHAVLSFSKMGIDRAERVDKAKLVQYFENIQTGGKRLLRLIDALLDLSRLEAGKTNFDIRLQNFEHAVEHARTELSPLFNDKSITCEIDVQAEDVFALFDQTQMIQVLVNLLGNAIKFSPESSTVRCVIKNVEYDDLPMLQCSIIDEGVGLPEEELEAVFNKFVQSSRTKTGAGGTGLGLSICQQIVKLHNGDIWVENDINGGACFSFRIPCREIKEF